MEQIKNITLAGLVVAVLALFAFGGVAPSADDVAQRLADDVSKRLGALTGPDIPYQYLSVGGFRTISRSAGFLRSSSSVCAFQPEATSTLTFASLRMSNGTNTALTWDIAKSANVVRDADPTATTTGYLPTAGVATLTGTQAYIVASTTMFGPEDGLEDRLSFGPNDVLVFKFGGKAGWTGTGANLTNHGIEGECKAEFKVN